MRDEVLFGLPLSLSVGGPELGLAELCAQLSECCGSGLRLEVRELKACLCGQLVGGAVQAGGERSSVLPQCYVDRRAL